ncbi:MerR family transcriptional regulator [Paenibacillus xylaniclasticus]|uniref:MerR family transcriptional regulator n=1 Tax=Paenibacillus xylaniclasticus TaxID=588083 RepID=UPI000FDAE226|nr:MULTISPECIES: MerR family transcriptional regulator [Paenibacillus]GFN32912.1 MerR family transcriptional regulator [Paenibacillus curdlanolyticus]
MNEPITYTIKGAAIETGLTEDTIRYYERIGLLTRAERKPNRHRVYRQEDVETMKKITCFRKTGMSLESIKPYLQLSRGADLNEHPELYAMMEEHKRKLENQIASLLQIIDFLDHQLRPIPDRNRSEACTLAEPEKRPPDPRFTI